MMSAMGLPLLSNDVGAQRRSRWLLPEPGDRSQVGGYRAGWATGAAGNDPAGWGTGAGLAEDAAVVCGPQAGSADVVPGRGRDRSFFNQYIRVRDLTTGASLTIGAGLAPCHALGSLSWTPDGLDLAVRYGQSQVTPSTSEENDGFGECLDPGPATVAVGSRSLAKSPNGRWRVSLTAGCSLGGTSFHHSS